jgi:hypothetical protein
MGSLEPSALLVVGVWHVDSGEGYRCRSLQGTERLRALPLRRATSKQQGSVVASLLALRHWLIFRPLIPNGPVVSWAECLAVAANSSIVSGPKLGRAD